MTHTSETISALGGEELAEALALAHEDKPESFSYAFNNMLSAKRWWVCKRPSMIRIGLRGDEPEWLLARPIDGNLAVELLEEIREMGWVPETAWPLECPALAKANYRGAKVYNDSMAMASADDLPTAVARLYLLVKNAEKNL